ncbi:hypothetical protein NXW13_23345 [Bacteroides thetaiotaomicron]|nr:hypothetical protein [Bacteroides thetaiotaomicron]
MTRRHTLTANGKYVDWTVQKDVSTFTKKEYPSFRRFIEKSANAYQSSYLFADGLGNHEEISDDDIIFIGNSSNKTYHKIIADREHKRGILFIGAECILGLSLLFLMMMICCVMKVL